MPEKQALDRGRGRHAERPSEISRRGWWDIVMRLKENISRTNMSLVAAGLAFYAFLAIPSALTALVALYGLIFNPAEVSSQINSLHGLMPPEAMKLVSTQLTTVTSSSHSTLGIALVLSILVALWSARSGTASLMTALNISYAEEEKRGFIRFQLEALALTLGVTLFALLSIALIAVLPAAIGFLPLGDFGKTLASAVRWPLLLVLVVFGFAALYRFAPSRERAKWRWISPGAIAATVLWLGGSALFSVYVASFASYDKTYGSLGAVVVLMMWLYLTSFAIMLGAGLNAEIEHQTTRDSTTGAPRPMGERGARMADTVGEKR
ncbi:MAG: YihY/virulence factor BrkB family protein [Stellaceae bacterium]